MRARLARLGAIGLLSTAVSLAAAGQQDPPAQRFQSAVNLTTVTATVTDKSGALVTDLPREAFDLFEDGERQPITLFTSERVPVSLCILLDVSDSMFGQRLHDARIAMDRFVREVLEQGDEYALMVFNHRQQLLSPWTSDADQLTTVMQPVRPFGSTAIYDAMLAALPLMEVRNRQRAALLIISDGADTASDATLRDVRSALMRNDAFVYAVAIDSTDRFPINTPVHVSSLSELTDQSGGRTAVVRSSAELTDALATIADELNHQYLLGYSSTKALDGRFHSIRVRVRGTDDRVRARNGFIAQKQN